jgi:hypothetical protein
MPKYGNFNAKAASVAVALPTVKSMTPTAK